MKKASMKKANNHVPDLPEQNPNQYRRSSVNGVDTSSILITVYDEAKIMDMNQAGTVDQLLLNIMAAIEAEQPEVGYRWHLVSPSEDEFDQASDSVQPDLLATFDWLPPGYEIESETSEQS